jgi:hypothetical protein
LPNIFRGVYSCNELLFSPKALGWPDQPPHALVVNTDTSNLPGQHWIAIYVTADRRGEVMDTYGLLPPTTVQRWLNRNTRHWTANTRLLQPPNSDSCGQFCIDFLVRRAKSDSMHVVLSSDFTSDLNSNERLVLSRVHI